MAINQVKLALEFLAQSWQEIELDPTSLVRADVAKKQEWPQDKGVRGRLGRSNSRRGRLSSRAVGG